MVSKKPRYRGDTPNKIKARELTWRVHARVLQELFRQTPHVFLASKVGGDIQVLLDLHVEPDMIWAVDHDRDVVVVLLEKRKKQKQPFRVFGLPIQTVFRGSEAAKFTIRSVYLDLCGNLESKNTRQAIQSVVKKLPPLSIISITLFRGRERVGERFKDREAALTQLVRSHSSHPVTLIQTIVYMSRDKTTKGSPMEVWSFVIGAKTRHKVKRYNLDKPVNQKSRDRSKISPRSLAAYKAWETRRAASSL